MVKPHENKFLSPSSDPSFQCKGASTAFLSHYLVLMSQRPQNYPLKNVDQELRSIQGQTQKTKIISSIKDGDISFQWPYFNERVEGLTFPAFISVVQYYIMPVSNVTINTQSSINSTPFCRCLPLRLTFPATPQLILLCLYAPPYVFQSVSLCMSVILSDSCLSIDLILHSHVQFYTTSLCLSTI